MCVRVIFHIRFPKKPREERNFRALAFARFGKPQNSRVRARSDFQTPISVGAFDFADDGRFFIDAPLFQAQAPAPGYWRKRSFCPWSLDCKAGGVATLPPLKPRPCRASHGAPSID